MNLLAMSARPPRAGLPHTPELAMLPGCLLPAYQSASRWSSKQEGWGKGHEEVVKLNTTVPAEVACAASCISGYLSLRAGYRSGSNFLQYCSSAPMGLPVMT